MEKNKKHGLFIDRTGEIHYTKQGCKVVIIECFSARSCTIQYEDGSILKNVPYDSIKKGAVKNLNYPSVFGKGYLGYGKYKFNTKSYRVWTGMLDRCYNQNSRIKNPTYDGIEVCKEWLNFQNFAEWFENNWKSHMNTKWQLDKDILCPTCKLYSPETCRIVPDELNGLYISLSKFKKQTTGIVKRGNVFQARIRFKNKNINVGHFKTRELASTARENYKKELFQSVANKWRNIVDDDIIEAVYNYYK